MSISATWSTQASPAALAVSVVMLALGAFSFLYAALRLALGEPGLSVSAGALVALAVLLVWRRLVHDFRRPACTLSWSGAGQCFLIDGHSDPWQLARVWQAGAWVAVSLQRPGCQRLRHLVVWKSAVEPPLWSELALLIQQQVAGREQKKKEKPHEPA